MSYKCKSKYVLKNYWSVILFFSCNLQSFAQTSESYITENIDPINVVNKIFYAANKQDFSQLEGLCDPLFFGDDDSKMICWLSDTVLANDATLKDFIIESGLKYENTFLDSARKEMKVFLAGWSKEFVLMFKNGRVSGEIKYSNGIEDMPDIPAASVPIQYNGIKGEIINSVCHLIKRNNKWYLIGI